MPSLVAVCVNRHEDVDGWDKPSHDSYDAAKPGGSSMNAVASHNVKFLSHSDQGGRGDGVQVMVNRGFAYIGHGFSNGITIIDVRDAKNPKTVNFLPCPPNTRAHHLQTVTHEKFGDLLLAVNGPSVWTMQVSQEAYFAGNSGDALKASNSPAACASTTLRNPKRHARSPSCRSAGWGRIASGMSASATPTFRCICRNFPTMSWSSSTWEPTRPQVVGKFWLPGM
jgi:hypothetical protein